VPELEYAVIANHAEAINGLLYLQGAGWTDIQLPVGQDGQPAIVHFGMGVSILVGWGETNRRFPLKLVVVHEDGDELASVHAQVEAGRPPGIPAGSDIRSVLAVNAEVQFPRLGTYEFRAELDGKVRTTSFRVKSVLPMPPGMHPLAS
jgi:Family of unknown function (DUF6941)